MNGAQDLGGMMGFGAVVPEAEHERFHAEWEKSAFACTLGMGALGLWNIDTARHTRESLPPAEYLSSSYYEIWFKALQALLLRHQLVNAEELRTGQSLDPALPLQPLRADDVAAALARGTAYNRPANTPARYAIGDAVRTCNEHPAGHTRLPRYARGRLGVVERVHGVFVFPDSAAHGGGEAPQWLYSIRFSGPELWGAASDPHLHLCLDAWESYLDPA